MMLLLGDVVMGTFGWDDVYVGYLAVGAAALYCCFYAVV